MVAPRAVLASEGGTAKPGKPAVPILLLNCEETTIRQ